MRVGVLSDTHGLLRPEARAFLLGCDHIIHGGDIGRAEILDQLAALAPVTAVRGNNDKGPWAGALGESAWLQLGGVGIYVIHDVGAMDIDPSGAGVQVVVAGHSHKPLIEQREGWMYVNAGSAGPRRFALPVSIAELMVTGGRASARWVELATDEPPSAHSLGASMRPD